MLTAPATTAFTPPPDVPLLELVELPLLLVLLLVLLVLLLVLPLLLPPEVPPVSVDALEEPEPPQAAARNIAAIAAVIVRI